MFLKIRSHSAIKGCHDAKLFVGKYSPMSWVRWTSLATCANMSSSSALMSPMSLLMMVQICHLLRLIRILLYMIETIDLWSSRHLNLDVSWVCGARSLLVWHVPETSRRIWCHHLERNASWEQNLLLVRGTKILQEVGDLSFRPELPSRWRINETKDTEGEMVVLCKCWLIGFWDLCVW